MNRGWWSAFVERLTGRPRRSTGRGRRLAPEPVLPSGEPEPSQLVRRRKGPGSGLWKAFRGPSTKVGAQRIAVRGEGQDRADLSSRLFLLPGLEKDTVDSSDRRMRRSEDVRVDLTMLRSAAGPEAYKAARELAVEQRVQHRLLFGETLTAEVSGSSGVHRASLSFSRSRFTGSCSCGRPPPCIHAIAVGLSWLLNPDDFLDVAELESRLREADHDTLVDAVAAYCASSPRLASHLLMRMGRPRRNPGSAPKPSVADLDEMDEDDEPRIPRRDTMS